MNSESIKYIPNAFYDMMVFIVPTTQFGVLCYIGCRGFDISWIKDVSGTILIIAVLCIVLFSYEYGRMAEALSAYLVQKPLEFLGKHTRFFKHPDFLKKRDNIYAVLGLNACYDGRGGDKWAIYLYAFHKKPVIGLDLLKRYAWEKLSRNSAFTYAVLLIVSLFYSLYIIFLGENIVWMPFRFGSGSFAIVCAIMTYLTYVEYYQRNVWNYDLLTKAVPILLD